MTGGITGRIHYVKGTPYQAGYSLGQKLGERLDANIQTYIQFISQRGSLDEGKLKAEAMAWLRRLPARFKEEYEGMAEGSGLPLERFAEWCYADQCVNGQCSGFIARLQGKTWVARNNDYYAPGLWGYGLISEIDGRIPTLTFGLEGDILTSTGVNRQKLWLHYNFLPATDVPEASKPNLDPQVFLAEALETCADMDSLELLLAEKNRKGGMLLFVIDGKNNDFAMYECTCNHFYRRDPSGNWTAGTNHYCLCGNKGNFSESAARLNRLWLLITSLAQQVEPIHPPDDFIHILQDEWIEGRDELNGTVFANVACPDTGEIWYTFGGYPAASQGNWQKIHWP